MIARIWEYKGVGRFYSRKDESDSNGKVVDDRTGAPVTRFNVKLNRTQRGSNPGWGYAVTWGDGGHTFDSVEGFFDTGTSGFRPGAEYRLTVHAEGFDPLTVDPFVMVPMSLGSDRTEFRLKSPTALVGRIVDTNDAPVVGARIRFLTDGNRSYHYDDRDTTFSDSNGEFKLKGLGTEEACIHITAPNYGSFLRSSLKLPRDSEGSVKIVLKPGAVVYGMAIGPDGQGVPHARMSAHAFSWRMDEILSPPYPSLLRTVTDANGYYEFLDLPAGPLSFRVSSLLSSGYKKVNLKPGQWMELNFGDEAGHTLTGAVRIGQKLLESAEVMVLLSDQSIREGRTDKEGRFLISGVPDGTYEVSISYYDSTTEEDWFDDEREIVVDGDIELDFDFGDGTAGGRIPERFIGAEGPKVYVHCWAPRTLRDNTGLCADWGPVGSRRVTIDAEGNFTCLNLRAGRYFLLLRTKQGTQAISDVFVLGESEHLENIAFNTGNARLQISVVDLETGEGVPQAAFAVQNELNVNFSSSTGLPQGTYIVRVDTPRYLPASSEWINLADGEVGSATVYLERAAVARFEVSPEVLSRITSESAYLRCRVIDPDTGRLIPKPTLMLSYHKEYDEHTLRIVADELSADIQPEIYLPEGMYEIEYRLHQDRKGYVHTSRPPLVEGVASVDLRKGETTMIVVTDD